MSVEAIPLDNTTIYLELEKYPWDKDKEFQGGLSAILGPNPSASQLSDLTLRAQCFYFSRKKSIPIEFDGYRAYLSSKRPSSTVPSSTSNDPSAAESLTSHSHPDTIYTPDQPPTSTSTPNHTSAMSIGTSPFPVQSQPSNTVRQTPPPPPTAPYPASFAEIVALIQSGAPIPGIEEISDEVHGLEYYKKTQSDVPKRRKPWEKDVPEDVIQGKGEGTFGDRRDVIIEQEFPEGV